MTCPEIYRNRTSRAWVGLDDAHFNWRNKGGSDLLFDVGGYCLDAPEQLPAGSVYAVGRERPYPAMRLLSRDDHGLTLEELRWRRIIAKRLIRQVIAEEAARGAR